MGSRESIAYPPPRFPLAPSIVIRAVLGQIRVHLAHTGHPLVGDPLYGGGLKLPKGASAELVAVLRGFRRQALHAEKLSFTQPATGEALSFGAERPADQLALIEALRADLAEHGSDHY